MMDEIIRAVEEMLIDEAEIDALEESIFSIAEEEFSIGDNAELERILFEKFRLLYEMNVEKGEKLELLIRLGTLIENVVEWRSRMGVCY